MYKLRLLAVKRYPNFVRNYEVFLSKKVFRPTDRQSLNCLMATKLMMVTKWKKDLFNKEKCIKIGEFFQKLPWNKKISYTKIQEKKL